jgi:isoleucyl-tRNA synthetase
MIPQSRDPAEKPESSMTDGKDYKGTLHLPQTAFAMKAKLTEMEPAMLRKWETLGLYEKILASRQGRPTFVLHDGPPYANGHIHLGTAMNKILKDFIIKSRTMMGHLAPYVPGWDCHGLPIEIHVDKLLGERKKEMPLTAFREECKTYALKFIDIQREDFKRLGVFGEWSVPYLTMNPSYEADILRRLAAFFAAGAVFKGKRPVHWCPTCRTALAEAEIIYKDKTSPSIYVKFPLRSDLSEKAPALKGRNVSVIIWTTTPWTLPANLAVAFHPEHEYAVFAATGDEAYLVAKRLVPAVAEILGLTDPEILATFEGRDMEKLTARHPFIDRESVFVLADYVTLEDGTGCVHTAPGHGYEDYLTGLANGLDVYTPVDDMGEFTPEVATYAGLNVFKANKIITADMRAAGTLLHESVISHSYPHCWRCKNPVIFRATSQWFISMDKTGLRTQALEEIKRVRWIPSWGEERIAGMVANRPDWCISRQRSWGVPIPAFVCGACGEVLAGEHLTRHVADIFEKEGANAWFLKPASDLLPPGTACPKCGGEAFEKEHNILDVWFESGASQSVLGKRDDLPWPADVYIEGHDQHRGWFNSSLLIGVGASGASPFRTCITHGFVLDGQGKAMSKSAGNIVEPRDIIAQNGAEILRLWIAMLNFKEDAPFGNEILKRLVEAYRKVRNTWRFILGNLQDFDPARDALNAAEMEPFDRWALERNAEVSRRMIRAYEDYEFHTIFHAAYNYFTVDLSAFYLDALKDRLYCSGRDSRIRRSAQTALFKILTDSIRLLAPLLPFTTEEAWEALTSFPGKEESVHLAYFPDVQTAWLSEDERRDWDVLIALREKILKQLETARESKLIGNALEAKVTVRAPADQIGLIEASADLLSVLCIVSSVRVGPSAGTEIEIQIDPAEGIKCNRCWNISTSVGTSSSHPDLCGRCEDVLAGC